MVAFSKRINIYFTNENDRNKFDDWFDHQLWFSSSEEIFDRIIEHLGDSYYSYNSKEDCIKSIHNYVYSEYDKD